MKVLVVEDDAGIRQGICDHFKDLGWQVISAMDGELGYQLAMEESYDVLVLDIMLPRVSGYEICKAVRREGKEVPILMLTAKAADMDLVRGFEYGATDYIKKPFSLVELAMRVKVHAKKDQELELSRAGVLLDLQKHIVTLDGHSAQLTDKESGVLALLMRSEGKVLTREVILNEVWGNSYLQGVRSVDRCIKTLRKKMHTPDRIQTVRQVGYYFE